MGGLKCHKYGASTGPILLCLHGFMGRAADWETFAIAFSMRNPGWQIWAVHLPGRAKGRLEWACPSADELAEMLVDLVREEGGAALAGYSMGGRLALHAALLYPNVFSDFIGISTTAGITNPLERRMRRAADAVLAARLRRAREAAFRELLREWWDLSVFDSPLHDASGPEAFVAWRLEQNPAVLAECLECWSVGILPPVWELLGSYPGRALMVSGEVDEKFTDVAHQMTEMFKHAQCESVPGAGHRVLLEKPRVVAHLVSRFFTTNHQPEL